MWTLLGWTIDEPFGEASGEHRRWFILPIAPLGGGVAIAVGMVRRARFEIDGFVYATALVVVGLGLVGWIGRTFERGRFGSEPD